MAERAVTWFWGRVATATAVPSTSLRTFRWIVGIYLLAIEAPHFAWIDRAPRAFFNPPTFSLAYLVGGFPPKPFFIVLDLVSIALIVLMILGIRTRAVTIAIVVLRIVGSTFLFSFGKIDHTIMMTAVLALMAWCNWGEPAAGRERDAATELRTLRALSLQAVVLAFGFLTAGLPKLAHWVDGDTGTSGFLSWYYEGLFDFRRHDLIAAWVPHIPLPLLEAADVLAVALELAGFVALLSGRIPWRLFLMFVAVLHLVNVLVLNIEFTAQAITYLAYVDLTIRRPRTAPLWAKRVGLGAIAVVVAWHVQARINDEGSPVAFVIGHHNQVDAGLWLGLVIGVGVIVMLGREVLRRAPAPTVPSPAAQIASQATVDA